LKSSSSNIVDQDSQPVITINQDSHSCDE